MKKELESKIEKLDITTRGEYFFWLDLIFKQLKNLKR